MVNLPCRQLHQRIDPQVRRIILHQKEVLRYRSITISISIGIPLRSVQRTLFRWKILGTVIREPRKEGPPKKLQDEHLQVCQIYTCGLQDLKSLLSAVHPWTAETLT